MATSLGYTAADAGAQAHLVAGVRKQAASREAAKADGTAPRTKGGNATCAASGKQNNSVDDDRFIQQQKLALVEPQAALPNQQTI